jgi:hypothetical protein
MKKKNEEKNKTKQYKNKQTNKNKPAKTIILI